MPRVRLKAIGVKKTTQALRRLPIEIQQPLVTKALMTALEPMRDAAKANAPDAEPIGQGLVDNIIITDAVTEGQKKDSPDPRDAFAAKAYMGVDAERPGFAPHALIVEFGSGPRYQENGKYVGEMPAIPFMRPAFHSTAKEVIRRFAVGFRALVKRAAKKVRAR